MGGSSWPVHTANRQRKKRADYLLRYTRDFPLAVVEAKADYKTPVTGCSRRRTMRRCSG